VATGRSCAVYCRAGGYEGGRGGPQALGAPAWVPAARQCPRSRGRLPASRLRHCRHLAARESPTHQESHPRTPRHRVVNLLGRAAACRARWRRSASRNFDRRASSQRLASRICVCHDPRRSPRRAPVRLTCAARGHRLGRLLSNWPLRGRHPIRKHDARQANTPPVYGHAACCTAPKSRLLETGRRSKRRRPQRLCVCTFGPCCAGATRFAGPAQRLRFRSSASRPWLLMAVGSRPLAHELKRCASQ
jgi:hypothetical protein